ncbi:hypothetical protein B0H13DRAFT_2070959 [Mycena leptocephala]|nr:hypothetical protein B0H13DRAFT_2070959 [Mycena leptocephala]
MGIDKLTRAHVEVHLAEELHSRRSKSSDLIQCLFGSLVDISSCAEILHEFLLMSILSVQKKVDGEWKDVLDQDFRAACTNAATHANEAVTPSKVSPPDPYRWKWGLPTQASEAAAALFFNVIAIAAHAASIRLTNAPHHPPPSLRFCTLPDTQRAVPLSNESAAQDCRPDVVAFDLSAFSEEPTVNSSSLLFRLDNCPFAYIRKNFPAVLSFTNRPKSDRVREFQKWFQEQEKKTHLDMTRFCWPEIELTAEAKLSDLTNAILQELVYMRQQRRTQPWMRSILGLVITTKVVGVLRADTLGVEQCTFDRTCSRGVLDSIRICLGVVRSSALQRGQHEVFELYHTRTLGPPHLKPNSGSSKTKLSKTAKSDVDVFSAEDPMVEYLHRTIRLITLRGNRLHYSQDGTRPDTRFYVHHLVQDNGSLVGRCARIFCVSRETESEGDVRNFVGPYALKLYNADCGSECFKDDLIQLARDAQVKNVLLPTWEWYYDDALSARGFPPEVVKTYTDAQAAVPNVASNRQEVFAQTDLKRLLVQSADYNEFAKAFIDFVEGIASLAEKDLLHRDLSIGNVLLSKDISCSPSFLSDAVASAQVILGTSVTFTQRTLEQRIGGLLHDLDMAGRAHPPPEMATGDSGSKADQLAALLETNEQAEHPAPPVQPGVPRKGFRTGTPPFMAIRLLIDGPPHLAAYDFHSLLFVLVLFFWSYPNFLTDIPFPKPVPAQSRKWPPEVLRWANRPVGHTLAELGALKRVFFQKPRTLRDTLDRTLDGDLWTEDPAFLRFFWALYAALWTKSNQGLDWVDCFYVTAGDVQKALTTEYQKEIGDRSLR